MKKSKRMLIWAAALVFCLWPAGAVFAEGASPLAIDNQNRYAGMDKSYDEGYVPAVTGDKALVMLPLAASEEIKDDTLRLAVNLGDASTEPFVFQNYDKSVLLQEHTVNGGPSKVEGYLITLELPLAKDRANGSYPVVLTASARAAEDTCKNRIRGERRRTLYGH